MHISTFIDNTKNDNVLVVYLEEWKCKQEFQEVLKFPIEIFWNLEASLKSELLYF